MQGMLIAIFCPSCRQSLRLRWWVSSSLSVLAFIAVLSATLPLFSRVGAPSWLVAIAVALGWLLLLRVLLLVYLRMSSQPFVSQR